MGNVFINPNFHVVLVHFPLGVFLLGVVIELLSFMYKRSTLQMAGRWMLLLGALATIPVAFSGIYGLDDIARRSQPAGQWPADKEPTWTGLVENARLRGGAVATHARLVSTASPRPDKETEEAWERLKRHVWIEGSASGLVALVVVAFMGVSDRMRRRLYYPCMVLLVAGAGLMGWGAWYAGESIYQLGTATRLQKALPAVPPADSSTAMAAPASGLQSAAPAAGLPTEFPADRWTLTANSLPMLPPFHLTPALVVSPTSEPGAAPTSDPAGPAPATDPATTEPATTAPATTRPAATAPATTEPAASATTGPATPATEPAAAATPVSEPATAPMPVPTSPPPVPTPPAPTVPESTTPASMPATTVPEPTTGPAPTPATPATLETTPATMPVTETTPATMPTTTPAAVAPMLPEGLIPQPLPSATAPAPAVQPAAPAAPVASGSTVREPEPSKVEDSSSPAFYVGPPLQIHVLLAGVAVAIALAGLGASFRRLALLAPELEPVSEADAAALEAQEAEALAANKVTGTRPVTEEDVNLVRSFKPGLAVGPANTEVAPAGRLWLFAFLGVLLTAAVGVYVLAAPASLGGDDGGANTSVLWGAIVDKAQNPEGAVTRRLAHVIGGAALLLFPLLLAIFARWTRSRLLLSITSFLLVLVLAAQVWIGILLLYDTRVGNITHFNTAPIVQPAPPPPHLQGSSA